MLQIYIKFAKSRVFILLIKNKLKKFDFEFEFVKLSLKNILFQCDQNHYSIF